MARAAIDAEPRAVFAELGFAERARRTRRALPTFRERLGGRSGLWHSARECGAPDCCKRRGRRLTEVYETAREHFGTTDPEVVRKRCHHWPRHFASKAFIKEYGAKFPVSMPRTIAMLDDLGGMARSDLPHRCVIKPEASSGVGLYLMHGDINLFDGRETPWERIQADIAAVGGPDQKVIVEEFLVQNGCGPDDPVIPLDYKLHAFGGKVRMIHVSDRNRLSRDPLRRHHGYFARDWTPAPVRLRVASVEQPGFARPERLDRMLEIGDAIAADLGDYMRIDLYDAADGIHLGEITTTTQDGVGFTEFGNAVMRQLWDLYDGPMDDPVPIWR
jgi:hypothetical protein